jgi:hypothetical protein
LVSGADLRNARHACRNQLRWNISRAELFGADEMRPIVFLPTRQRVATGGVSSPPESGTRRAWNFPPETGFLSGGAMNCALRQDGFQRDVL